MSEGFNFKIKNKKKFNNMAYMTSIIDVGIVLYFFLSRYTNFPNSIYYVDKYFYETVNRGSTIGPEHMHSNNENADVKNKIYIFQYRTSVTSSL